MKQSHQSTLAFVLGMVIGGFFMSVLLPTNHSDHHDNHPIANPYDDEYHVHIDFHIVIAGELLDLSGDEYQTTSAQEVHPDLHLHDNNGDVEHIHAEEKTFAEFLSSLDITLTSDCLTTGDNQTYCADTNNVLRLYVNGSVFDAINEYIPTDDDSVLVYYGADDAGAISTYIEAIPDDSCYYSGTCPERGTAPPESCGLTCEL